MSGQSSEEARGSSARAESKEPLRRHRAVARAGVIAQSRVPVPGERGGEGRVSRSRVPAAASWRCAVPLAPSYRSEGFISALRCLRPAFARGATSRTRPVGPLGARPRLPVPTSRAQEPLLTSPSWQGRLARASRAAAPSPPGGLQPRPRPPRRPLRARRFPGAALRAQELRRGAAPGNCLRGVLGGPALLLDGETRSFLAGGMDTQDSTFAHVLPSAGWAR